jgi:two-component system NarL family sensor kinase
LGLSEREQSLTVKYSFLFCKRSRHTRDSLTLILEGLNAEDKNRALYFLATLDLNLNEEAKALERLNLILKNSNPASSERLRSNQLLGKIFFEQRRYDLAEKYYEEFLYIANQKKDFTSISKAYSNLSSVYYTQGLFEKSLSYQRKAIESVAEKTNNKLITYLLSGMAPIFIELDQLDSAEHYYNRVLQISDTQSLDRSSLYINLGLIQDRKGFFTEAEQYYQKALKESQTAKNKSNTSLSLNNLAYLNYYQENYKTAFEQVDSAIALEAEIKDADFAKSIRNLELKYEDLERDKQVQDLTFKAEQDKTVKTWGGITAALIIAGLSGLYISNRKRLNAAKQLAQETLLRHQKEKELAVLHSSIQTLELERKRTAMDLHDGIGALASSVKMRVSLVQNRIDSEELLEHLSMADSALNEIAQDVKRIAFDIMPTTLHHLGLIAGIEDFIERLPKTNNIDVSFYSDAEKLNLSESTEISIFRIVQELINNGIKYSEGSTVSLELTLEATELVLYYYDDGVGFTTEEADRGNGQGIIHSRVMALKGTIQLESSKAKGTSYKISIPHEN